MMVPVIQWYRLVAHCVTLILLQDYIMFVEYLATYSMLIEQLLNNHS